MASSPGVIPRQRGLVLADLISLLRLPLAVGFLLIDDLRLRIAMLVLAGASDLGDGWVARRRGGSGIGELLDPVTDKVFMAAAFFVVIMSGSLTWLEGIAVLFRDIVATVAFLATLPSGHRIAVPARAGGKIVTTLQLLTILLCLLDSPLRQPLVWLTAGAGLYAVYDYYQPFFRKLRTP